MKRLAQIPAPAAAFGMFEAAPAHETRDLPGFVIEGVTYASHHITLTVARAGRYTGPSTPTRWWHPPHLYLTMIHGGGTEYFEIDDHILRAQADSLLSLPDALLYGLFYATWDTYGAARRGGAEEAAGRIKTAFVEGRLRKRKQKGESRYRVWIEPQTSEAAISSELTQLRETP